MIVANRRRNICLYVKQKKSVNITIYQAKNGAIEFRDDLDHDTIWSTQKQISEVFGVNVRTVNEHLKNILKTGELEEDSVIRKFRITAADGKLYNTKHYNLDVFNGIKVVKKTHQILVRLFLGGSTMCHCELANLI